MRLHRAFGRLLPFAAFAVAACGGQSCTCLGPIQGGFPTDQRRHDNALQLRVTQGALDYLAKNGKALVSALLPGGSTFNIPPSCGGKNEVCCGMPQPTCQIDIGVQEPITLAAKPPNTLSVGVRTTLVSKAPFPVSFDFGLGPTHCMVSLDTTKGSMGHKDIGISPDIQFTVDGTTHLTSIGLTTTIADLDPSMIDLAAVNPFADFACTLVQNVGFIKSFVITQLKTNLQDTISGTAAKSFCARCKAQGDCDSFADACTGGQCMRAGKCVQEIGAVGKLDVGALFASLSPSTRAGMDTLAVLGTYAEVQGMPVGGISLGMIGGGQGDPHAACVPIRPAPSTPVVPKWAAETGSVEPLSMKPYHLALGIHASHLNTMGWAAFDGGALCLAVGTAQQPMLNTKTLGIIMPSLGDLIHGNEPVTLVIRPQQEPVIAIGDGTFNVDKMGKKTIKDALLHVTVPNFAIDFYAFVDDRYVRIMTLTADLAIPISLDVDAMGQIVPLLGDLGAAFTNVRVTNSELLLESPAALAKSFPTLLGVAVSSLGSALKPVALPKIMGLNLSVVAIEPTDGKQFISFFTDIALATMDLRPAATEAAIERVVVPRTGDFSVEGGLDPALTPRVELALSGRGPDGRTDDLEWQWSFDGFRWSPWSSAPRQSASDPVLWLQGRHAIQVRARVAGEASTTDPQPPRLEFLVDTVAPAGEVEVYGRSVRFRAEDAVSPREALEYRWSDGASAGEWSHAEQRILPAGADPARTLFQVRDEAGNVAGMEFHGRTTDPAPTGGCGCTLGAKPRPSGAILIAVLGMMIGLRSSGSRARFRRRGAAILVAATSLLGGGSIAGCHHSATEMEMPAPMLGKADLLDPADQIGRYSDAAARKGVIHISAYDDTTGDLAYAQVPVAAVGQAIAWQWVDGVPTATSAGMPDSYRKGISDKGDDVGLHGSLALDAAGRARIAYYDATHKQLKIALADEARAFTTSVVDLLPAGRAGLYTSISLDAAGVPSIAYAAVEIPDGMNGYVGKLRLANAKSAAPKGPADWEIVDLDKVAVPCAGLCPSGQTCLQLDPADPLKKSQCKPTDGSCGAMCGQGQACVGGKCTAYLAAPSASDLVEGTGLFARMVRTAAGRAIAYYDREQGDLDLQLEGAPGQFARHLVDGNDNNTDVGQFATAAVTSDTIHLAYVDAITDRLLYKTVTGGQPAMAAELIDDGVRMDGPHPVGGGAAIWSDAATVRVAYQDQALSDLWVATRPVGAGGTWSKKAVQSGPAGSGFYPHLVDDGGKVYLTGFVYDRAAQMQNNGNAGSLLVIPLP